MPAVTLIPKVGWNFESIRYVNEDGNGTSKRLPR